MAVLNTAAMSLVQAIFITTTLYAAARTNKKSLLAAATSDYARVRDGLPRHFDLYNATAGCLVLVTYGYIFIAACYLPPRGVDDLSYHLPSIYEYVQSHEIKLLPVRWGNSFAFPQNAELLFMWPILFTKNQDLVTSLNIPFVAISFLALYALLRNFDISEKDSLFASLLYALSPVVIMQCGVNYVDIIVSAFTLAALYLSIRFYSTGNPGLLYATGLATGLVLGMKYTALALTLPVHLLICVALFRYKFRGAGTYVVTVLLLSAWWYVRNYLVLGNPTFPLHFLGSSPAGPGNDGFLKNVIMNLPQWPARYLVDDIGIGTYDGGFGMVFWGVGFSSWLYYCVHSLCRPRQTGLTRFFALAYLPAGFLLLLAVPEEFARYNSRFAIFVVGIGLWTFCETIKLMEDGKFLFLLKTSCLIFSVLTVTLMFQSQQPTWDISDAVHDRRAHNHQSKFKYLNNALPSQAGLKYLWHCLDAITTGDQAGLNCYLITDGHLFAPAPVYGTNLQNHVAYAADDIGSIDAFLYTYYPDKKNDLYHTVQARNEMPPNFSVNASTDSYQIVAGEDYRVISHSGRGCLIVRKRIADDPVRKNRLRAYYLDAFPGALESAREIAPLFTENVPVITSNPLGYGLRYADRYLHRADLLVVTPGNMEGMVAASRKLARCYSIGTPLEGYASTGVTAHDGRKSPVPIYLNWR